MPAKKTAPAPAPSVDVARVEAAAKATPLRSCPRCYRVEGEFDQCPNASFPRHKCPTPVALEAGESVTLRCGPCGFTRTIPVADLISGKARKELPNCKRDACAAKAI